MGYAWAERQRRTNKLVRAAYEYLIAGNNLGPEEAHALCRLTWITRSYEEHHAGYIQATKLPALRAILPHGYFDSLDKAAGVVEEDKSGGAALRALIPQHSGFTNFYGTYRGSSRIWVADNWEEVYPILQRAFSTAGDGERVAIARAVDELPLIPSPSGSRSMVPWDLLAPVLFALDPEASFPIANGSKHVKQVLRQMGGPATRFSERVALLIQLMRERGFTDAADLDQLRDSLDMVVGVSAPKSRVPRREGARDLPLKDASDYEVLKSALSVIARRVHNELTNRLLERLADYSLLEGEADSCRYDVLIKKFCSGKDVLVEVKASTSMAEVRMAVGQLFDYHRQLPHREQVIRAVLLPKSPSDAVRDLLSYTGTGLMYFEGDQLHSEWPERKTAVDSS